MKLLSQIKRLSLAWELSTLTLIPSMLFYGKLQIILININILFHSYANEYNDITAAYILFCMYTIFCEWFYKSCALKAMEWLNSQSRFVTRIRVPQGSVYQSSGTNSRGYWINRKSCCFVSAPSVTGGYLSKTIRCFMLMFWCFTRILFLHTPGVYVCGWGKLCSTFYKVNVIYFQIEKGLIFGDVTKER